MNAILVVGYNNIIGIKRLCDSLVRARYSEEVDIIFSIDFHPNNEVRDFVSRFDWPFGKKISAVYDYKLGLKKHVMICGSYMEKYNYKNLIVLEDDIVVAENFYEYSKQTIKMYSNIDQIEGVSLYSHKFNINVGYPFIPLYDGYDVFFINYAQSWGQIWFREKWKVFYDWYISIEWKTVVNVFGDKLPDNIKRWPESSWLKYHIAYCIIKNKYFVYPFSSISTNFTDEGTHNKINNHDMQVPLDYAQIEFYKLPFLEQTNSIYDGFFENKNIPSFLKIDDRKCIVDLYGVKNVIRDMSFMISTQKLNFKIVDCFSLVYKPFELNIFLNLKGQKLILYDLSIKSKNRNKKSRFLYEFYFLNSQTASKIKTLLYVIKKILDKVINRFLMR